VTSECDQQETGHESGYRPWLSLTEQELAVPSPSAQLPCPHPERVQRSVGNGGCSWSLQIPANIKH